MQMLTIEKNVCSYEDGIGDKAEIVQDPKAFCCKTTTPLLIAFSEFRLG